MAESSYIKHPVKTIRYLLKASVPYLLFWFGSSLNVDGIDSERAQRMFRQLDRIETAVKDYFPVLVSRGIMDGSLREIDWERSYLEENLNKD